MSRSKQIEELKEKSDQFEAQIKEMQTDSFSEKPKEEYRPPEVSQKEIAEKEVYIKPTRWIADGQKFNPRFEKDWEFAKEYVQCICVHNECRGDIIEFWTHPFGGKGAEFWRVPSDKPVWIPRYAAEQLTRCKYHRMKMDESQMRSADGMGTYYGSMIVQTTVQRIDAVPVSNKRSIFMGKAA